MGTLLDENGFPVPHTPAAMWSLVPAAVRAACRARVPLDAEQHGTGAESLVVAVGPGAPFRVLQVEPLANGAVGCRLYEWRRTVKEVATANVIPATLPALLVRWAREYGLGG